MSSVDPFQPDSSIDLGKWNGGSRSERVRVSFTLPARIVSEIDKIWQGMEELRSRDDYFRYMLEAGHNDALAHGVQVSWVLKALVGARKLQEYNEWREYSETCVAEFRKAVLEARTPYQFDRVKELGDSLIEACEDPVIAGELAAIRDQMP